MAKAISIDRTSLAALCRRHHIRRLSLFGSVLRPDFRPDSDVDVLVEFEPGQVPGFLALHAIEMELSKLLGGRAAIIGMRHKVVSWEMLFYAKRHAAFMAGNPQPS